MFLACVVACQREDQRTKRNGLLVRTAVEMVNVGDVTMVKLFIKYMPIIVANDVMTALVVPETVTLSLKHVEHVMVLMTAVVAKVEDQYLWSQEVVVDCCKLNDLHKT